MRHSRSGFRAAAAGLSLALAGGLLPGWAAAVEAVSVSTLVRNDANGGITVHPNGDLYIGEFGNFPTPNDGTRVFRVTPEGESTVFASDMGLSNSGNDFDPQGFLIQSSFESNVVWRVSPQGNPSMLATVPGPVGVVARENGEIFVSSCEATPSVWRIDGSGNASRFAFHPEMRCTNGLTQGPDGTLYSINFGDGKVFSITPQGNTSVLADIGSAGAHIVYGNGELYATGRQANAVFRITLEGDVTRLAGSGPPGSRDGAPMEATFSAPNGIAISNDGRFLYTNGTNQISVPGGGSNNAIRVIELALDEAMPINFGHAGSWYEPATDGQGFSLEIVASPDTGDPDQAVAYWFTFARGEPGGGVNRQRWFQAVGPIADGQAVMEVFQVTGGVFDDASPVDSAVIGTATIRFASCTTATLSYELDLNGDGTNETTGEIELQRLTPDLMCDELAES